MGDDLRDLLQTLTPSAREHLRNVLIRDQADRDAIASRLMRYRDQTGDNWAYIIDFLTMYPDARCRVGRTRRGCPRGLVEFCPLRGRGGQPSNRANGVCPHVSRSRQGSQALEGRRGGRREDYSPVVRVAGDVEYFIREGELVPGYAPGSEGASGALRNAEAAGREATGAPGEVR